jgi:hypothetical protein
VLDEFASHPANLVYPAKSHIAYARIIGGFMRLTREAALWCAIALLAVLPRALGLDHPLSNAEATSALLAHDAAMGASVAFPNPLFGTLQMALFAVLVAGNVTARLISAIAGVVLCLLPLLLRDRMGRTRALWMGVLLALSPTLWFASHQAGGAMLAWALAFAAFCAWGRRGWLDGVLAGVLLANGQDALTPVIVLVIALLASGRLFRRGKAAGYDQVNTSKQSAALPLLSAGIAFALASTALFLRPQGLGDAFNGFALWAQDLRGATLFSVSRLLAGFALNDTLILLAGISGVVVLAALRRFTRDEWGWAAWAGAGAALFIFSQGRDATMLVPVVIGGAAFASVALRALVDFMMLRDEWIRFAVAGGLAFILCIYAGLGVRQYAGMGQASWLLPVVIALLLMLAVVAGGSLIGDVLPVLRGVLAGVLGAVLLHTLSSGLQMTFVKPDNAAEAYRADAAEDGLAALDETIQVMSRRATGEPRAMVVQVPAEAPAALRWLLRDQRGETTAGQSAPALLTRTGAKPAQGNYIGHAYPIASTATLDNVGCKPQPQGGVDCLSLVRWIAFRDAGAHQTDNWIFWIRDDLAAKASGNR